MTSQNDMADSQYTRRRSAAGAISVALISAAALLSGCEDDDGEVDAGIDVVESTLALEFVEIELDVKQTSLTDVLFVPGTADEVLLLNLSGTVTHARTDGEVLGSFDLDDVHQGLDCGLISGAFDPGFEDNGFVYFSFCTSNTSSGVYRYDFDAADLASIDASAVEIIAGSEPAASNPWHNVGALGFDSSGALWTAFGEKTIAANSQNTSNILGTLVRVIPSREAGVGRLFSGAGQCICQRRGPRRDLRLGVALTLACFARSIRQLLGRRCRRRPI